jgi:hypothetical protein
VWALRSALGDPRFIVVGLEPQPGDRQLLALSAFWPLPLVNVIPGAIIVLIAIAYLQEDGLLLVVAAAAAFLSLEDFGWTLWRSGGRDAVDWAFVVDREPRRRCDRHYRRLERAVLESYIGETA